MIRTLLRIGLINMRRDRVAQAMTFILPILFFSIFALVFGSQRSPTRKISVAIADEDHTQFSARLIDALQAEGALRVQTTKTDGGPALDAASAEALVKSGTLSVALVLPKGLGRAPHFFGGGTAAPTVKILADVSDPIAPQMVQGLLQKVSFTAMPDAFAREGIGMFETYSGPLTPAQRASTDAWLNRMDTQSASAAPAASAGSAPAAPATARTAGPIGLSTQIVNVMQPGSGDQATVSFYAAGIGVMFLLFSSSAAGGSLLDEQDSGTLGRLIGSRAGMTGVLAGKWIFLTLLGMTQLTVMFVWGALVFHLPLFSHLPGFAVVTLFTAAAAASFGLVLATLSRTRQQLGGMSTIIILTMSALGGSMFPRFLMSETMQKMGLVTFNAWALDGYLKVFWREAPILQLWPQVGVLVALTTVFLVTARSLARRWEAL